MSAKQKILNAAACVVDRAGAAHLTIEAVAAEAELSKGGVLYHFPTKRSMLEGMVQHVLARTRERADRHRDSLHEVPHSTVRALITAEQEQEESERAMSLAILAAAAEDPSLLDPARAVLAEWFADAAEEGRVGVLLLLAVEGMRFLNMLNLLPMDIAEQRVLRQDLLQIAEGGQL